MTELTQERLQQLFTYDADEGVLYWNRRPLSDFATARSHALWNTKHAGKAAGSRSKAGYVSVGIGYRHYLVHRLIWVLVHGSWPDGDIDHVDGVPSNNRIGNLRCVPHRINLRNQKRPKTNKSGIVGVAQNRKTGRWLAKIYINGKTFHLGSFVFAIDAIKARQRAERKYGFHENHGRIALTE